MEKSIENIWKEGFLKKENLTIPKIEDLYNKKSKSIVDRMIRTMKINVYALYIMSAAFFLYTTFIGVPMWVGMMLVVILSVPASYSWWQMGKMDYINASSNSYEYLKQFQTWLSLQVKRNVIISRFMYPGSVLAATFIVWFSDGRKEALEKLLVSYPDLPMVGEVPLYLIIAVGTIASLMALFAGKIYKWDVNIVYGRQFSRLKEIISDLEELRK